MFQPVRAPFALTLVRGDASEVRVRIASWLKYWLRFLRLCGRSGTVIFDIDDTLVDADEAPFPEMHELFRAVQRMGFSCALVTARPGYPDNEERTRLMLRRNGFDGYLHLDMMPADAAVSEESISRFKRQCRRRHRNVVANIGDRWWDHTLVPPSGPTRCLAAYDDSIAAIAFLPRSDGEVSLKLPASSP